jgi:FlaA1/EpsC-like NDP-sugar epimerase
MAIKCVRSPAAGHRIKIKETMAEPSINSGFGYRKAPFGMEDPSLNVVEEGYVLKGANALFRLACPQATRFCVVLGTYAACLAASFWLAYQFRFDFAIPGADNERFSELVGWVVPLKVAILLLIVQFDGLLSYFSIPDLRRLCLSLAASTALLASVWWASSGEAAPPRGVILGDLLISFLLVSGVRLLFRLAREKYVAPAREWNERMERVGIVGAGDVGASLARELSIKSYLGLRPVAFFDDVDDDRKKWRCRVHNIPVIGAPESLLHHGKRLKLDRVILAIPSASNRRCQEIAKLLRRARIRFETVPSFDQLATGKVTARPLRELRVEELFGNERSHLDSAAIRQALTGKVVLVTGAGGRIGSELSRQIAECAPRQLLLVEECEVQIFQIEQDLIQRGHKELIVPLVADLSDSRRLERIFEKYRPEVMFHGAAHHHVRLMENHPSEAIKANCIAVTRIAEMASRFGVSTFVLLSSAQARHLRTVVGATARFAEMVVNCLGANAQANTRFMTVRMDELIGSSDRIIRKFHDQIEIGGPLNILNPSAICYPITIGEAAGLVLQCVATGTSGESFRFNLGRPIKLLELAHKMIELFGLKPDQDIEIEFTGASFSDDARVPNGDEDERFVQTSHCRIQKASLPFPSLNTLQSFVAELGDQLDRVEPSVLQQLIRKIVSECEALASGDSDRQGTAHYSLAD